MNHENSKFVVGFLSTLTFKRKKSLTLFDMCFFEPSVMRGRGGGRHEAPHDNFVVIAPMIMKFGTDIKLDVFYTMVTKSLLLLLNYVVITCILAYT